MTIPTIHVCAASKADINRRLDAGLTVMGVSHVMGLATEVYSPHWPHGAVIKVYKECIGGSPYVRAYGTVRRSGDRLRVA